jgi:altronate dehydratase small subunit
LSTRDALQLDPADQVATALRAIQPGETITVSTAAGDQVLTALEAIPLCHKIALETLPAGTAVRKYGDVIGRLIRPAARGSLIHTHNLRSERAARPPSA